MPNASTLPYATTMPNASTLPYASSKMLLSTSLGYISI